MRAPRATPARPEAPRAAVALAAASFAVTALAALSGCGGGPAGPRAPGVPPVPLVLAVNGLGETLTLVRADSLAVLPGEILLGTVPNDVAVDATGEWAAVVNSVDNDLVILSLADSVSAIGRVDLGVGSNPYAVALDGRGHAFVSLLLTGEVARVDVAARAVTGRFRAGQAPEGVLPLGSLLLVTVTNFRYPEGFGPGEVLLLDPETGEEVRRIRVGTNPQSAALAPDGRIHVVCTGNYGGYEPPVWGAVYVLDAAAEAVVDSLAVGGSPVAVAITDEGKAYLAGYSGGLVLYDAATLERLSPPGASLLAEEGLSDLVWDAARGRVHVASFAEDLLYVLDARADTLVARVPLGDGPVALALRP